MGIRPVFPVARRAVCTGLFLLFLAQALVGVGCVRFVPDFDQGTMDQAQAAYKKIDAFYVKLFGAEEGKRSYAAFKEDYGAVGTDLRVLILRNEVRSYNEDSTEIVRSILTLWEQVGSKHQKDDAYSSADARLDRSKFERYFKYFLRAQNALKP